MDLAEHLLDSWDRQSRIVLAVASRVTDANRRVTPPEGWPLDRNLAHVHNVRQGWLETVAPKRAESLATMMLDDDGQIAASLEEIHQNLEASAAAIRAFLGETLNESGPVGGYDHPVFFLQHMVWHEGWHVGLLMLGLRLAGEEPPEEWEDAHVWGEWRVE